LGIEADYDYTPRMYRRIVFAAVHSHSFAEASESLAELSELTLLPKRIWRAARRIGEERVAERQAAVERYDQMPLPARRESPVAPTPQLVSVQMDGGRYQRREREESTASSADGKSHWREFKAGCLLTMCADTHAVDPAPLLPAGFADPGRMRKIAQEIKGFTSSEESPADPHQKEEPPAEERPGRPEVLVKSVVASTAKVGEFGPQLASAAYERGFHAAPRRAFVADGAEANWGVHERHFSSYTAILDFVHALMYVYAAALVRGEAEGWTRYRDWAQWLWSGQVDRVIAALEALLAEAGPPPASETGTPRAQWAESLGYLRRHRHRMKYDEYRRNGLPITSAYIESTVKQINRRMKGTEKFWADADPLLSLVADRLSQTRAAVDFWRRRTARLINPSQNLAA
jgi:hypothetical protein